MVAMTNDDFNNLEELGKRAWEVYLSFLGVSAPKWEAHARAHQERWVAVGAELWADGFEEGLEHADFVDKYLRPLRNEPIIKELTNE